MKSFIYDEGDQEHDDVVAAEENDASKDRKSGRQMLQVPRLGLGVRVRG